MQALEVNRRDSWSSHCLAHVYEMQGQYDKGLSFLDRTINDWQVNDVLTPSKLHIFHSFV